jgi:hypothetical protein
MMVNDHCVVYVVHLLLPIKPRSMSRIVLGFLDLDENPINEPPSPDTTLELKHMLGKNSLLLLARPLNLIINYFIIVGSNENTSSHIAPIPYENIIHDTLSCFIYRMNWSMSWFGVSLVGHLSKM